MRQPSRFDKDKKRFSLEGKLVFSSYPQLVPYIIYRITLFRSPAVGVHRHHCFLPVFGCQRRHRFPLQVVRMQLGPKLRDMTEVYRSTANALLYSLCGNSELLRWRHINRATNWIDQDLFIQEHLSPYKTCKSVTLMECPDVYNKNTRHVWTCTV